MAARRGLGTTATATPKRSTHAAATMHSGPATSLTGNARTSVEVVLGSDSPPRLDRLPATAMLGPVYGDMPVTARDALDFLEEIATEADNDIYHRQ